jgi:hypothetical protein
VAASALIAGPAGASTPEVFAGSATGTALNLSLAGTQLTGGVSLANAKSPLQASSEGVGVLTPGLTQDLKTSVNGTNQTQNKALGCAASLPALPGPLAALTLKLACSSSSSTTSGNNPSSDSTGQVALAGLSNVGAVPGLPQALDQVGSGADQIPTIGPVIKSIVNSISGGQVLDAPLGPSHSSVTTSAGTVVSKATAQGATINLFNVAPVSDDSTTGTASPKTPTLKPLLSLTLGSATATATYDRHTGKSSGTFDPALLTLTQNTGLPGVPVTTSIVPGQTVSIPPTGTAVLTIKVGDGSSKTNPDGSVTSVADGVSVAVLPGQAPGGADVLDLDLAHAQASAGGAPATVTPAPHPPTLPFTGEHPWIPFAGLGFLGGALGLGFIAFRSRIRLRRS